MDIWFFFAFAVLVLGGAVLTVVPRNPVHCAIGLMISLVGTAGIFLLQRAEFLFAAQIILYVGGILVLFLFVIMLVNLDMASRERQFQRAWPVAAVCLAAIAAEIAWVLRSGAHLTPVSPAAAAHSANTEEIGSLLLTGYLLPFEIASILLLVAVVGSVVMGKERLR